LDRRERGRDVEDVEVADVTDPEDLSLERALPVRDRDPEPVTQSQDELGGVDALGRANRGHDRRAVLVGGEKLEAHRLCALAAGAAEPYMAVEDRVEPCVED